MVSHIGPTDGAKESLNFSLITFNNFTYRHELFFKIERF